MTRINTIDPVLLPTPWLTAEYRELPRILNRLAGGKQFSSIPDTYRMGAGHVTFFGDKAAFLACRHFAIVAEMKRRNPGAVYVIDVLPVFQQILREHPELAKYWTPTAIDHAVCLGRLAERWTGDPLNWGLFYDRVVKHHNLCW